MGLDMYLYEDYIDPDCSYETGFYNGNELAYWRKANCIHGWMKRNGVPMGQYEETWRVSREDLMGLVVLCRNVYDECAIENIDPEDIVFRAGKEEFAERLLPTERGFFFGSAKYDSYYLSHLQNTISQIERILEEREDQTFVYAASW